jgi:hypothetical protein
MQDSSIIDRHGKPVAVGDIVRIVKLSQEFIDHFAEDDQVLILSMVGQFFKIYGIDELGQPYVCKEWHDEHGRPQTHVIALDADEMERV